MCYTTFDVGKDGSIASNLNKLFKDIKNPLPKMTSK